MKSMSNAFFWQAEIVQTNRWTFGPLELAFFQERFEGKGDEKWKHLLGVHDWNNSLDAGFARPSDAFDAAEALLPGVTVRKNPNIVLVPTDKRGVSQMDVMLASLLPSGIAEDLGLDRKGAILNMSTVGLDRLSVRVAKGVREAFTRTIWSQLAPTARLQASAFAPRSSLRLLAGDARFWMNRLYRVALERRDLYFEPTTHEDKGWKPLDEIRGQFLAQIPEADRHLFVVRRPLCGGYLWDGTDEDERIAVLDEAIGGMGVMESLDPVIEVLHSQRAHEDFSPQFSWIKEDFERSFYSKRAKLKVDLVETIDDAPVWSEDDNAGYGQALFRDVLAFLNMDERRLTVALRMGKTVGEIAQESGLKGHASISRKVDRLKKKIQGLLH